MIKAVVIYIFNVTNDFLNNKMDVKYMSYTKKLFLNNSRRMTLLNILIMKLQLKTNFFSASSNNKSNILLMVIRFTENGDAKKSPHFPGKTAIW